MIKTTCFIMLLLFIGKAQAQQLWNSQKTFVSFFSSTIMEDIEAKSASGSSVLDGGTGAIVFKVANTSFHFKKKLMQEHFNENYMESEQHPYSTFKGKLKDMPDLSKNGTYVVAFDGSLDLHGVTKAYQGNVNLVVANGMISTKSLFKIRIADHDIKIPKLVFKNIAEYVEVRIEAQYLPK
jgi:hypothetical protein